MKENKRELVHGLKIENLVLRQRRFSEFVKHKSSKLLDQQMET
jgi:hypothetical protein